MKKLSELEPEKQQQAKKLITALAILGGIAIILLVVFILR